MNRFPLWPLGSPTVQGAHCPCGNQRSAKRRCCRACERYFWARDRAIRPVCPPPVPPLAVRLALAGYVVPRVRAGSTAAAARCAACSGKGFV